MVKRLDLLLDLSTGRDPDLTCKKALSTSWAAEKRLKFRRFSCRTRKVAIRYLTTLEMPLTSPTLTTISGRKRAKTLITAKSSRPSLLILSELGAPGLSKSTSER